MTRRPISSTEADSSSVADATDCMLLEASSEAPATWLDRLWVVSAVRVSVPAAASSCTADAETLATMAPTAALEIVGKADQFGAARGARRLVLRFLRGGIALGLGDGLHLEFLDRARHLAEFVLAAEAGQHDIEIAGGKFAHRACTSSIIGREMPLPRKKAQTQPSRKPPAASIRISRSVSAMVASDSASSRF